MMRSSRRALTRSTLFFASIFLFFGINVVPAVAQQAADTAAATDTTATADSALNSVWGLITQANGFQYPIFGILVVGLFLIVAKIYELYKDRKAAEDLEEAPVAEMDLKRITMLVANQEKSMLAKLEAEMLNVFRTIEDASTLHEEIANFLQYQRERFNTFKRRVDFLADTAGAVGLLGTVWGMFTLFFGGNISDKQAILTGMGTALVSTLLGLVVSITLNLISTEVYSFFDNRIDQIEDKADELRFRLMELTLTENGAQGGPEGEPMPRSDGQEAERRAQQRSSSPEPSEPSPSEPSPSEPSPSEPSPSKGAEPIESSERETNMAQSAGATDTTVEPTPHRLNVSNLPEASTVGSTIRDVRLTVTDEDGSPVPDEPVRLRVEGTSGTLEGKKSEISLRTDSEGTVSFDWHLPEDAGTSSVEAEVPSSEASETNRRLSVETHPGSPTQYAQKGNNQGAEVGDVLPKPLVVRLFDAHDNPVPGISVKFQVETGAGAFEGEEKSKEVSTDKDGKAAVQFSVGEEPGLNVIVAAVGEEEVKFQAMALEQ